VKGTGILILIVVIVGAYFVFKKVAPDLLAGKLNEWESKGIMDEKMNQYLGPKPTGYARVHVS
jgi:hypothetical protein